MTAAPRQRVDVLLVERGIAPTRERAQALVLAGLVSSNSTTIQKPGQRIPLEAPLEVAPARRWVGRGAGKLEPALLALGVDPAGRDALDVGASTGGFTQVLLDRGARRVLALDVGRGQLDWSLRSDPRVAVLDGVNARHLKPDDLPFPPSLAVIDVSFISLELVLPPVAACCAGAEGEVVALVKPQFEVGRGKVGRGGVVRDPALHAEVLARIVAFAASRGLGVSGVVASALRGAEGNVEFFVHVQPSGAGLGAEALDLRIREVLRAVHGALP